MTTARDKVSRGQALSIPSDVWNDLLDLRNWWRSQRQTTGGAGEAPSGLALVQNGSGAAVDAYQVLGITGVVTTPAQRLSEFQQRWALSCSTPSTNGKFVVTAEPIPSGKFGFATVYGLTPVQIAMGDSAHPFADVVSGDVTKLASGYGGSAQIMYEAGGVSTNWALVRLGNAVGFKPLVRFTLDGALAQSNATAAVTIQSQHGLGRDNPTTSVTAHNLLTHAGGTYVFYGDAGDAGWAIWDYGNVYRMIFLECPD